MKISAERALTNLAWRLAHIATVVSVWLVVSRLKSFTDAELERFAHDASHGFEPEKRALLHELRHHRSGRERRMSDAEIEELAALLAGDDAAVRELLAWNMRANHGRIPDAPRKRKGIWFWPVGRNASHEFYAGTKGCRRFRYSVGEGARGGIDSSRIEEVPDWSGYYGHF